MNEELSSLIEQVETRIQELFSHSSIDGQEVGSIITEGKKIKKRPTKECEDTDPFDSLNELGTPKALTVFLAADKMRSLAMQADRHLKGMKASIELGDAESAAIHAMKCGVLSASIKLVLREAELVLKESKSSRTRIEVRN